MEPKGLNALRLNELADACRATAQTFALCAERARRAELRQLFAWRAQEFRQLAGQLDRHGQDGDLHSVPHGRGPPTMPASPATSDLDDVSLLDACEVGEQDAVARLVAVLADDLPESLRTMLTSEQARMQRHQAQIRSLRSRLADTA